MAKKKRKIIRESGYGKYGLAPPKYISPPAFKAPKPVGGGSVTSSTISAPLSFPPNVDQILAKDPFYQASHGTYLANQIADQATRDAAIKRAIIDFGGQPGANIDPAISGVIDPGTLALAQSNTDSGMSVLARLAAAAKDQRSGIIDSLASRGTFNTGFTGTGLARSQLQADQGQYDARKNLLDYLAGVQAAFVAAQRAAAEKDAQDALAASQNWDGTRTINYTDANGVVTPANITAPGQGVLGPYNVLPQVNKPKPAPKPPAKKKPKSYPKPSLYGV